MVMVYICKSKRITEFVNTYCTSLINFPLLYPLVRYGTVSSIRLKLAEHPNRHGSISHLSQRDLQTHVRNRAVIL